jgi:uncharacterized SAM-binding protein YcdF (DUF218 family)
MTYLNAGISIIILLLICGLICRASAAGKRLLIAGTSGLILWSWPPAAALFSGTLEWWYPVREFPVGDAQAMVVLSANIVPGDSSQPQTLLGAGTYLRCQQAAWLYRNWKPVPILATGGPGVSRNPPVAEVMARALSEAGVPSSMVWKETASRSTHENAVYSARLLREKGIRRVVLVTEAYHMLRVEKCFRKQGVEVEPLPFAYRSTQFQARWRDFFPSTGSMKSNDDVLHEWAGLAWYRISGRL